MSLVTLIRFRLKYFHLPLPGRDLHGPDEGGGVAGDGHGAGDPPGEDEDWVPGDEGGDQAEDHHGDGAGPDGDLPPVPVRHQPGAEGPEGEASEESEGER